jgi:peptide/nickel transport system substrate-binding protein
VAPTSAAQPRRGGILRLTTNPVVNLDPHRLTSGGGITVVRPSVNFLVRVDEHGNPAPDLATSWTPSDDVTTWTFKLRQGVKFHNGAPLTAADVVATYQRLIDKSSGSTAASALNMLTGDGVSAPDDSTVVFHLTRASADFPFFTYIYQAPILPANWPGDWAANPWGTGPFRLQSYTPEQGATFVRNEAYWETGLPYLDGLDCKVWQDASGEVSSLQSGASDVMVFTPYDVYDTISSNPNIRVLSGKTSAYDVLHTRVDQPPFDDLRVRQALALAVNRPDILQLVLHNLGDLASDTPIAPALRDYVDLGQRQQNVDQAKQLLADAGHPNGFEFDLYTHTGIEQLQNFALTLQQQLAAIGVTANLKLETSQTYFDHWTTVTTGVTEWASRWTLSELLNTAYRTGVNWNSAHWSNPDFDKQLDQLDATVDPDQRKAIVAQLGKTMMDATPVIITYHRAALRSVSTKVQGPYVPGDNTDFRAAWLQA